MMRRPSPTRLYRNSAKGKVAGVCAGLGDYFGINPLIFRCLTIAGLFVATLPTIAGYVLLAWLLDDRPADLFESEEEKHFWQDVHTRPRDATYGLRHRFREFDRTLRRMEAYVTSTEFELNRKIKDLD